MVFPAEVDLTEERPGYDLFTVTDLKQFAVCPRVVFYEQCLPKVRPRTFKMEMGRIAHEEEPKRATRRSLGKYDVSAGQRTFDYRLTAPHLGLTGIIDEMVRTSTGEVFPVDYKLAKKVDSQHRLQLTAYAMMIEETEGVAVDRGFVYLIPTKMMVEIRLSSKLREDVAKSLAAMQQMVSREQMPKPTSHLSLCVSCEFRRFCNDV